MSKRRNRNINTRSGFSALVRRPSFQLAVVALVAFIVYLIALAGGESQTTALAAEVNSETGYQMVQDGAFMLDVRERSEWDEYHAPMATLIPLGELQSRLSEVPKDREILVVCRSGNRSQQGRDILLAAGFNATSMAGGMKDWYAKGYPIDGTPPQ
jgi:rhodanese-related sulfurtransferase